ncbi:phosphatidate phosphatase LPIN3-like [Discoglossus pictus]
MNYVGQLAGSVLGRVRELYNGVNPATLTGSIDVVVVKQPDGSFISSPFHVRFGKLGVLRSAERVVDIEVNGEPVDLQMILGENGEAFFIQEIEESEDTMVSLLSDTSTLLPQDPAPLPSSNDPSEAQHSPKLVPSDTPPDTPLRRQRWVKRASQKRGETAGNPDVNTASVCDSIYFSFSEGLNDYSPSKSKNFFNNSDEETEPPTTRSPSPKSDSELEMRVPISPQTEHCMEWDWGRLPQITRTDLTTPQISQSAPSSPTSRDSPLLSPTIPKLEDQPLEVEEKDIEPKCAAVPQEQKEPSLITSLLGPDDMLSPDSQEVSLYFPNSDPHPPPPPPPEESNEQVLDEDIEPLEEPGAVSVALSLCGGLADSWDIPEDRFLKHQVTYPEFCQNPSLIEDPRLVVRIHNKFYNWAAAAPVILCMQAFNQDLPQTVIKQHICQKMPPRNRGWWFSWRRRDLPSQQHLPNHLEFEEQNEESNSSRLEETKEEQELPPVAPEKQPPHRRSLRLTSDQIKHLNLHCGANEVIFSVCTKFQGTTRCRAEIYLWDSADRIIVSDIDGTITRSDALGHILPQLGKDWTQPGIVQLYHAIHMNGYKFVYCSARSVGLAELTKGYLQGVSEGGCSLPLGPLLLSPSSLFAALHREVIEKVPERFKISCLSDIQQLFTDPQPFYAAFGNRPNDVVAYKQVGVPESRIFTVNSKGELTKEQNSSFRSSYSALSELVNVMFPPFPSCSGEALLSPGFSHFSFWRDPVPELNEDDFAEVS